MTPDAVLRPGSAMTTYARNARTQLHEQINQVAASIRDFGFANPVLVTELFLRFGDRAFVRLTS
jgi:hypothetical protein